MNPESDRRDPELPASPAAANRSEDDDVERLFREHNAALLRFIVAKIGSEQDAREIAQEAYVQLLRLNQSGVVSYQRAFLFKAAANLAVDRLRQQGRRRRVVSSNEVDVGVFELTPERQIAGQQEMDLLRTAIGELPPKCRQAFLLQRVDNLSSEEISARMGIHARMIRRYVARAVEYLCARLDGSSVDRREGK